MADSKKSVLLYCDLIHTVEKLTTSHAGKLFKHYLRYVNDLNPESEDILIDLVFEPIKQSLKRDLKKWEGKKEVRSISGRIGNLKRWHLDLYNDYENDKINLKEAESIAKGRIATKGIAKVAVSVSDSVNVSVNEIIDKSITYTKKDFLLDWNLLRDKHLKKPSFLNTLRGEDLDNFNDLIQDYTQEDFSFALIGLFKQKKLPNDNKVMQSNPKHFLKYFNTYLTAYHDKNTDLYGKNKQEY